MMQWVNQKINQHGCHHTTFFVWLIFQHCCGNLDHWETWGQGEKVIQLVKPKWIGYKKNWQINMMDKLLQQMAMVQVETKEQWNASWLLDDDDDNGEDGGGGCAVHHDAAKKYFFTYGNIQQVQKEFKRWGPMLILRLVNGTYGCVICGNKFVELRCGEFKGKLAGSCYHEWDVSWQEDKEYTITTVNISVNIISNYCLLLPKLVKTGLLTTQHDAI